MVGVVIVIFIIMSSSCHHHHHHHHHHNRNHHCPCDGALGTGQGATRKSEVWIVCSALPLLLMLLVHQGISLHEVFFCFSSCSFCNKGISLYVCCPVFSTSRRRKNFCSSCSSCSMGFLCMRASIVDWFTSIFFLARYQLGLRGRSQLCL